MEATPRGRDLAVVSAAIGGRSSREIAQDLGISQATVNRARAKWHAHIREGQDRRWEELAARSGGLVPEALETLAALLSSPQDAIRVSAAKALLDNALRLRTAVDLQQRLEQVEDVLAGGGPPSWQVVS